MATRDIISKLTSELDKGITTEAQAVYEVIPTQRAWTRRAARDKHFASLL
jgi:hypothetical protein